MVGNEMVDRVPQFVLSQVPQPDCAAGASAQLQHVSEQNVEQNVEQIAEQIAEQNVDKWMLSNPAARTRAATSSASRRRCATTRGRAARSLVVKYRAYSRELGRIPGEKSRP